MGCFFIRYVPSLALVLSIPLTMACIGYCVRDEAIAGILIASKSVLKATKGVLGVFTIPGLSPAADILIVLIDRVGVSHPVPLYDPMCNIASSAIAQSTHYLRTQGRTRKPSGSYAEISLVS